LPPVRICGPRCLFSSLSRDLNGVCSRVQHGENTVIRDANSWGGPQAPLCPSCLQYQMRIHRAEANTPTASLIDQLPFRFHLLMCSLWLMNPCIDCTGAFTVRCHNTSPASLIHGRRHQAFTGHPLPDCAYRPAPSLTFSPLLSSLAADISQSVDGNTESIFRSLRARLVGVDVALRRRQNSV